MDINSLSPAEQAALAKADEAGVHMTINGVDTVLPPSGVKKPEAAAVEGAKPAADSVSVCRNAGAS